MVALLLVVVSLAVPSAYSSASGPPARSTGATGDLTCAQAGCHTGTPVNGGGGSVAIAFPSGTTYTPGLKQTWTITITDSAARVYGFQATARLGSNISGGQAGSFTATESGTAVFCDNDNPRSGAACPSAFAVEFIQHTSAKRENTFTVEWMPPATDVGNVRVFISANAANGNAQNTGDRIYTANYTLTPAAAQPTAERPAVSSNGVVNALSLAAGVAGQAWTRITGTGFAAEPATWKIEGDKLPTELGGVSVTVNQQPVAIGAVTPTQITALVPVGIGTGDVAVVVKNAAGESTPVSVLASAVGPALLAPFRQEASSFLLAVARDGTLVGKAGEGSRATRLAKRGELLSLFGTGFGQTKPELTANQTVPNPISVAGAVRIRFGEAVATMVGTGSLIAPGVYQFQVIVPETAAGDVPVVAEIDGQTSAAVLLAIEP
ncbi:MAG: IPT/TIG domain-containing protein [Bryobacterales bacterium]|nr:IPT/TIG domain-containing protein [Bryobacterales bacterium]